ncbi:MAG: hypothetical protein PCFJNLEI_03251 [Verrucomicrobiae bacterium]|nr:hypothetical protein [Verrucomicrobiae bacterium]
MRHLVLVLGDQLDTMSAAREKLLAKNQRMTMQLKNLALLDAGQSAAVRRQTMMLRTGDASWTDCQNQFSNNSRARFCATLRMKFDQVFD